MTTTDSSALAPFSGVVTEQELNAILTRIRAGTITLHEYQAGFARLMASRAESLAAWDRLSKRELSPRSSPAELGKVSKADLIARKWAVRVEMFVLHEPGERFVIDLAQFGYGAKRRSVEETTAEFVAGMTATRLAELNAARIAFNAAKLAEAADRKARLADPQTLADYRELAAELGEKNLSADQRRTFEALQAEEALGAARSRAAPREIAVPVLALGWHIVPTWHFRQQVETWTVRKETRGKDIPRDEFAKLNAAARALGGKWERFTKTAGDKKALAGFLFFHEVTAQKFLAALGGETIDNAEEAARRQQRAETGRAENLAELAERTRATAEASLGQDRKTNTYKRSTEAFHQEQRARGALGLADSLERVAAEIAEGRAKYLRNVAHRTQVETLDRILATAQWRLKHRANEAKREGLSALDGVRREYFAAGDGVPELAAADVDAVLYPWPHFNSSVLAGIARDVQKQPGAMRLAARVQKLAAALRRATGSESIELTTPTEIELVQDLARKAPRSRLAGDLEDYTRVQAMGLVTLPMLRAALREYLGCCKGTAPKEDPLRAQERALVGRTFPGYFPTPRALAAELVELAELADGQRVLEPSAGKGDIAEAIRRAAPGCELVVFELQHALREVLTAKGFTLAGRDFLEATPASLGTFDRIVMNPPFEDGADIDHVRHAFGLLRPGGRVVAIMSEGPFYRADRKATAFRTWLAELGGHSEKNPEGSFLASDNPTSVATRVVTIDRAAKPREDTMKNSDPQMLPWAFRPIERLAEDGRPGLGRHAKTFSIVHERDGTTRVVFLTAVAIGDDMRDLEVTMRLDGERIEIQAWTLGSLDRDARGGRPVELDQDGRRELLRSAGEVLEAASELDPEVKRRRRWGGLWLAPNFPEPRSATPSTPGPIRLDDPEAVGKLRAKLATTEAAFARSKGPARRKLDAERRRIENRIEQLQALATKPKPSPVERGGFRVSWDAEASRIAIESPRDKDPERRKAQAYAMKARGFQWAPSRKRYQRLATEEAWHSARRVVEGLTPGLAWAPAGEANMTSDIFAGNKFIADARQAAANAPVPGALTLRRQPVQSRISTTPSSAATAKAAAKSAAKAAKDAERDAARAAKEAERLAGVEARAKSKDEKAKAHAAKIEARATAKASREAAKLTAKASRDAAKVAAKAAKTAARPARSKQPTPEQEQAARDLCGARVTERATRKTAARTERLALNLTRQHGKALQRLQAARCKADCKGTCKACKRKECMARPQVRELAQQLQAAQVTHATALRRHAEAVQLLAAAGIEVPPLGAPRAPKERTGAPPRSPKCGTVCHIQVREGICGGQAAILLPSAQGSPREVPTRYCMVEADQLITSHDPVTFDADPRYPAATQERRYDRDRAEQGKVIGIAQNPRPELIFSTSASPLDGTPIATPDGIVLGGNGRSMGIRLHYARGGEVFRDYLLKVCSEFGFTPAQVRRFRVPVVVRTVDPPQSEWARYVRDLNQGLTQAMDVLAEGVSLARQMPREALDALANGLAGDVELGDFFGSRASLPFIQALERGGIVTAQNRGRLLRTSDGLLTEEGRALAIRQISASILPDADLLELAGAELRQALARSAPYWLSAAAHGGEWDVRPPLMRAVRDLLAARAANLNLRRYFQQADFFQPPHTHKHPIGLRMLVLLEKLGGKPAVFSRVARFFAGEADMYSGRQASLLAPKLPVVALDDAALQAKLDLPAELRGLS